MQSKDVSLRRTIKENQLKESQLKEVRLDRAPSLYNMLGYDPLALINFDSSFLFHSRNRSEDNEDFVEPIRELKASIIEGINELIEEIKNLYRNVADQAIERI